MTSRRDVVVLESFPQPQPTTNPYVVMLLQALQSTDGLTALTFSWRRALTARYDVFHVHWPELLVSQGTPLKRLARCLLFLLLVARLTLRRVPVVRTLHNLRPHEGADRVTRAMMRLLERRVTVLVSINRLDPPLQALPVHRVLHGDYRDWYASHSVPDPEPGRLGFFGLIRPYKGVEDLLDAFEKTSADVRLTVGGRPQHHDLETRLRDAAATDPRLTLVLGHLSDAELVDRIGRSTLVVLPYRTALNSGVALAALSLARPVLMPANDATRALADEVGQDWVRLYEGELTAEVLAGELDRAGRLTGTPDLSERRWSDAGPAHLAAFCEAISR